MTTVNYDNVAATYDQRVKSNHLPGTTAALKKLAQQINARRILDLGCGTGRSLQGPAADPNLTCYGLDFSGGMLGQAKKLNADYRLVRASAPWPPFRDAGFDMILSVLALHHFPDKNRAITAAYRMLRAGGALAIVNTDPHQDKEWFVYKYFEGTYQTDLQRFLSIPEQGLMLRQAGFQQVSHQIVEAFQESPVGEAILDNYWLRKDSGSQLILLSDDEYEAGLGQIRQAIDAANARGETITFFSNTHLRMCFGFKPE